MVDAAISTRSRISSATPGHLSGLWLRDIIYSIESSSSLSIIVFMVVTDVGSQQKWDTFVKERSGGDGGVLGLPEQAVVAFALG